MASDDTYTIEVNSDEMEYLQSALFMYMERMQQLTQEHLNDTLSRNDILETVGQHEDPVMVPQPEDVNVSDVFSAQYVTAKQLRARLVEMTGYDMTEES